MSFALNEVRSYPSPNIGDVLFYELVQASETGQPINEPPAYGTAHPNSGRFPNHKLVLIAPSDKEGWQRWFYAANRSEQEEYNWRVSYPFAGLTTAPSFSCVFVLPRAGYAPVTKGTAHPLDLGGETLTANLRFRDAKLVVERQIEIGFKEIESLYIAVERVYVKVPEIGEQFLSHVETSYPFGGLKDYPRRTYQLIYPRHAFETADLGAVDPITGETKLIAQSQVEIGSDLSSLYVMVRRVYDKTATIAAQEAYNAEREYPYLGSTSYPRTVRSYLVPKADALTAVIPSAGLSLGGATFAFRKDTIPEGVGSDYYAIVTVAHDKIPALSDGTDLNFLKGFGYQVTRPFGTDDHFRVTWRVPSVKSGYTPTAEYTACPIAGHTGLLLIDEAIEADQNNASNINLVRVYDSLPGPEIEEEIREKFADVPEGFIVERKIERLSQPVKNDATIGALNSDAPNDVGGALVRTSLGAGQGSTVVYEKGSVRLTCTFGTRTGVEYDEATGRVSDFTEEIVDAGTVGAALDSNGEFSIVQPLNQYFSIKTTRKASTLGTGDDVITFQTTQDYYWPNVLSSVTFFGVEDKAGNLIRLGYDVQMKDAYQGPCVVTVVKSWKNTPHTLPSIVQMQPKAIKFDFPMTRVFYVEPCLHAEITISETVGSGHPTLHAATTSKTFLATNYTDWPSTILAYARQYQYKGGFALETHTVAKPA